MSCYDFELEFEEELLLETGNSLVATSLDDHCINVGSGISIPLSITVAVDTEFELCSTLTVQAATRLGGKLTLACWKSGGIPKPRTRDVKQRLSDVFIGRFFESLDLKPIDRVSSDFGPADLLAKLLSARIEAVSRERAEEVLKDEKHACELAEWDPERQTWRLPTVNLTLVGHFLEADIGRLFGCEFYSELHTERLGGSPPIVLTQRKRMGFAERGKAQSYHTPVLQYARVSGTRTYFAIRVQTRDTRLIFNGGSLGDLTQQFLGFGKAQEITGDDLKHMKKTFKSRPDDAYTYALQDAAATLLLHEKMQEADAEMYQDFDFPLEETPLLEATSGRRTAKFLELNLLRFLAGSTVLDDRKARMQLLRRSHAANYAAKAGYSRWGEQTALSHGGLAFSRTGTRLWHEADGQFRDLDLSSCYASIMRGMDMFLGRPVVHEPGASPMLLSEAAELMCREAPHDGWFIRVSGTMENVINTLIPSTCGALNRHNYRKSKAKMVASHGKGSADFGDSDGVFQSKLFSKEIISGLVSYSTWQAIRISPESHRAEYGRLRVDSIVFYPLHLIADSMEDYDALFKKKHSEDLPWASELKWNATKSGNEALTVVERRPTDHENVSVRFPLRRLAGKIAKRRVVAKDKFGSGSREELVWKLQANSMYGVVASRHYPVGNVVAAAFITSTARAAAFMMINALNGFQVITDGCTYRRDQIPRCTFRECLEIQPDYQLRRADQNSGIPFYSPEVIPAKEEEFKNWYRQHLRKFFEIPDEAPLEVLGSLTVEHKKTRPANRLDFDALAVDGGSDYIKYVRDDSGQFVLADMKKRGFARDSRNAIDEFVRERYPNGQTAMPGPILVDNELMKLRPAIAAARTALIRGGKRQVMLPLGMERAKTRRYKVIKLSAFVFQDERQFKLMSRQFKRFSDKVGLGFDILAMRENSSFETILAKIYDEINLGKRDLSKALNLRKDRFREEVQQLIENERKKEEEQRQMHQDALTQMIGVCQENYPDLAIVLRKETISLYK